jgi:putative PIN family toxin of toxin-antitoxin system
VVKVVPDSNVWISAFNFGGVPRRVIEMGVSSEIRLAISNDILLEVWRVQEEKFKWSQNRLQDWQNDILTFTEKVETGQRVDAISADPTDNRILECAVAACADYIVTGDKHLLRLLAFVNTQIIKPADLQRRVQGHFQCGSVGL